MTVAAPRAPTLDPFADFLCVRLANEAERVRWDASRIPWDAIERDRVTPRVMRLVRQAAYSEQTTFTATSQFVQDFATDFDFSQWVSVWFFEETRHPQALMRWLASCGETFDEDFIREGRVATPFMKSRTGTLVSNIISEMFAAAGYLTMSKQAREPVLSLIARNLACDEARHASSFYSYARKSIETADDPKAEKLMAAKVLYFWLHDNHRVTHPVNQLHARAAVSTDLASTPEEGSTDMGAVRQRACNMIGTLIGRKIETPAHVREVVRSMA